MQRSSAAKEEKMKKKIDEEPNASFSSLGSVVAKNWFVFFFVNVLFAVVVCVCVVYPLFVNHDINFYSSFFLCQYQISCVWLCFLNMLFDDD